MKSTIITTLLFILLHLFSYSQSSQWLGQTKDYIIKSNSTCFIAENTDDHIAFECDGHSHWYYFFGGLTCTSYSFTFPKKDLFDYLNGLKAIGYKPMSIFNYVNDKLLIEISEHDTDPTVVVILMLGVDQFDKLYEKK